VRDYVGAELIEVSEVIMKELKNTKDGAFLETRKHPTGDMYLLTKHYTRSDNPMTSLDGLFEDKPHSDLARLSPATQLLLTQDVLMRTEAVMQPRESLSANNPTRSVAESLGNRPLKDTLVSSVATTVVEDFAMQMEAESLPVRASLEFMADSSGKS
jgi:hypothetical protein